MKLVLNTNQFILRYFHRSIVPPVAIRYMASPIHPIRPKIVHLYANRDRNTLWWRVAMHELQPSTKRVVRSWCARRVRLAFVQALRERGFNQEGKRIAQKSPELGTDRGTDADSDLKGSVEITVHPNCIKEEHSVVQQDINFLLDSLLQKLKSPEAQATFQPKKKTKGSFKPHNNKTST